MIGVGDPLACTRLAMTTSPPSECDLPTIFDPVSLVKKGLCPVTEIRSGGDPLESHSLYYEQHGTGVEKIVFVMGWARSFFVGRVVLTGSLVSTAPLSLGRARSNTSVVIQTIRSSCSTIVVSEIVGCLSAHTRESL